MRLTLEEAKQAGYEGYAEHLLTVPCPRLTDPRIYCATCQDPLLQLPSEAGHKVASSGTGLEPPGSAAVTGIPGSGPANDAAPGDASSDRGYSEETCVRCGWKMGDPPLNCQNDDTPHRFPSQLRELHEAAALALDGGDREYLGDHIPQEVWDDLHERNLVTTQTPLFGDAETRTTAEGVEYLAERLKS
jgi:hypothetical protein